MGARGRRGAGGGRRGDRHHPALPRGARGRAHRGGAARGRVDARAQGADGRALGRVRGAAGRLRHVRGVLRDHDLGPARPDRRAVHPGQPRRLLRRHRERDRPRARQRLRQRAQPRHRRDVRHDQAPCWSACPRSPERRASWYRRSRERASYRGHETHRIDRRRHARAAGRGRRDHQRPSSARRSDLARTGHAGSARFAGLAGFARARTRRARRRRPARHCRPTRRWPRPAQRQPGTSGSPSP